MNNIAINELDQFLIYELGLTPNDVANMSLEDKLKRTDKNYIKTINNYGRNSK